MESTIYEPISKLQSQIHHDGLPLENENVETDGSNDKTSIVSKQIKTQQVNRAKHPKTLNSNNEKNIKGSDDSPVNVMNL